MKCLLKSDEHQLTAKCGLQDVKVVKSLGGTVDESEVMDGLVLAQKASRRVDFSPRRIIGARICLAQFHISMPKSDMESAVVISKCIQVDRLLEEGRHYVLRFVKVLKSTGCNVLILQKSILRDALSDVGDYYLARAGILTVRGVERDELKYISRSFRRPPTVHIDLVREEMLCFAEMVEEVYIGRVCVTRFHGLDARNVASTIFLRGSNYIVISETERAMRDVLCVVRNLISKSSLLYGGGSAEVEVSRHLVLLSRVQDCTYSYCVRSFADSIDFLPYTLADNAGLDPAKILNIMRSRHGRGHVREGISVFKNNVSDMSLEGVVVPLIVLTSAISLSGECSGMILRIDCILHALQT